MIIRYYSRDVLSTKYVKKSHHKKKTNHKIYWKRPKKHNPYWTTSPWKRLVQKIDRKRHRRWEKQRIQSEDYEAFHRKSYNEFMNPWHWD